MSEREILFRGKRVDNNAWIEGPYIPGNASGYIYLAEQRPKMVLIYRETVGQYTGLKDKNGQRIFEGDILESQIGDRHRWVVSCVDGGFEIAQIGVKPKKRKFQGNTDQLCDDNLAFYNLVVIGNIHDNPELMEAE